MAKEVLKKKAEQLHHKVDDLAENGDQQKIIQIVVIVAGIAAFFGLVMLVVPSSILNGITDKFAQREVETVHSANALVVLQINDGEKWEAFGKKVQEDGRKNIKFPATLSFLRSHCNLNLTPEKQDIYRKTYLYLKTVPQLKNSTELMALDSCKVLEETQQIQAAQVGQQRDYEFNKYEQAQKELAEAEYQINTIKQVRRMNKEIYGNFYDEATGKSKVEHKSHQVMEKERQEEEEYRRLLEKVKRAKDTIAEYESKHQAAVKSASH